MYSYPSFLCVTISYVTTVHCQNQERQWHTTTDLLGVTCVGSYIGVVVSIS